MERNKPKEYIENISRATTQFTLSNGPIKSIVDSGKINEEEMKDILEYMQNHLAYLYTVLLEENDLKKFELVVNTMTKFYTNNKSEVLIEDDGFNDFYANLFPNTSNIKFDLK